MRSSATLALLGLVASASAQMTHTVVVGGPGQLTYTPSCLWPAIGDKVIFEFHEKNHTATQSSFASPCTKMADASGAQTAFDSGFHPVAAGTTSGFPTMTFDVTDDKPKWFYCAQGNHCSSGMVFAINPPREGNTFDAFLANAKSSGNAAPYPPPAAPSSTSVVTVTQTTTVGDATPAPTSSAAPAPSQPAQPTVHMVIVGDNGGLTYNPSSVKAAPGDIVSFQFTSKNHTITQSSFGAPCRKTEFTSTTGQIGFDSGFMPVAPNANAFPMWNMTVNSTEPIWAYCRQANHCGNGMVFAINAADSGNKTFTAYQALAKQLNGTSAGGSSSAAPSATAAPSANGASHLAAAGSWLSVAVAAFMMLA